MLFKLVLVAIASSSATSYFLAPGGWSCEKACMEQHSTCDEASIGAAAQSVEICGQILQGLGKKAGSGQGQYVSYGLDDNSGCTFHPGQAGWFQVMHKDGEPECAAENADSDRQRVCSCVPDAIPDRMEVETEMEVTVELSIPELSFQHLAASVLGNLAGYADGGDDGYGPDDQEEIGATAVIPEAEDWESMSTMPVTAPPDATYHIGPFSFPYPSTPAEEEYEYGDGEVREARGFRCMLSFLFYTLVFLFFLRLCRRMRQARRAREERVIRGKGPIVIKCAVVANASPIGKAALV